MPSPPLPGTQQCQIRGQQNACAPVFAQPDCLDLANREYQPVGLQLGRLSPARLGSGPPLAADMAGPASLSPSASLEYCATVGPETRLSSRTGSGRPGNRCSHPS